MFASRARVSGNACIAAAFPADDLHGLPEAIAALASESRSSVVPSLIEALDPQRYRPSRSAAHALYKQGRPGVCAAPAIASWFKLTVDGGLHPDGMFGINDVLTYLTTLRSLIGEPRTATTPQPAERIAAFLDEVFRPYLLSLLTPPVRYWQRGIVDYLRALHGDLEATAIALQRFEVTLRESSGAPIDADWNEYTFSETVALLGDLGPHVERLRIEREWREQPIVVPPPTPLVVPVIVPAVEPDDVPEQTLPWAIGELAAPSISRRVAACRVIARMGTNAQDAVPALRILLAGLDDEASPAVASLRDQARTALQAVTPSAPAPVNDDYPGDDVSVEAVARLLALASEDNDSRVRTAALHALVNLGTATPDVLAVALRAADAEDPGERMAAASVLGMLARNS